MMRGEDVNLDLNNPKMRVVVPAGKRKRGLVMSGCGTCNRKSIMMYGDKSRYLQEQLTIRCRRSGAVYSISEGEGGEAEEIAISRPRMPQLVPSGASGNGEGAS